MNPTKTQVIKRIAGTLQISWLKDNKCKIGSWVVHVRECSNSKNDGYSYGFSVYESTLGADYEVWICGHRDCYYLIPMSKIREMCPTAYRDKKHGCPVMSVDVTTHRSIYSSYRGLEDFSAYFTDTLKGKSPPRVEAVEW